MPRLSVCCRGACILCVSQGGVMWKPVCSQLNARACVPPHDCICGSQVWFMAGKHSCTLPVYPFAMQ